MSCVARSLKRPLLKTCTARMTTTEDVAVYKAQRPLEAVEVRVLTPASALRKQPRQAWGGDGQDDESGFSRPLASLHRARVPSNAQTSQPPSPPPKRGAGADLPKGSGVFHCGKHCVTAIQGVEHVSNRGRTPWAVQTVGW